MSTYSRAVDEGGMLHKWNDGVFVLIHEQTSSDSSVTMGNIMSTVSEIVFEGALQYCTIS